jgi:hypothetical protein
VLVVAMDKTGNYKPKPLPRVSGRDEMEIIQTLELTKMELEACYKRLGYTSSNVLKALDETIESIRKSSEFDIVKLELENQKEGIRKWLISEDFEGLAERL